MPALCSVFRFISMLIPFSNSARRILRIHDTSIAPRPDPSQPFLSLSLSLSAIDVMAHICLRAKVPMDQCIFSGPERLKMACSDRLTPSASLPVSNKEVYKWTRGTRLYRDNLAMICPSLSSPLKGDDIGSECFPSTRNW